MASFIHIFALVLNTVLAALLIIVGTPMTLLIGGLVHDLRRRLRLRPGIIRFFGIVQLVAAGGIIVGFWQPVVGLVAGLMTAPIFIGASIHHKRAGIRNDVEYRLLATVPIIFAALPIAAGPVANILQAVLRH